MKKNWIFKIFNFHVCKQFIGRPKFVPDFEAVCSRQNPAGVDKDSSAAVEVFPEAGLVNIDESLPWLLCDVAISASEHAESPTI